MVFEVTSTITDPGGLPFKDLFVLSITDPSDAKDDVLARVATPLDIQQTDPSSPKYVRVAGDDLIHISGDPFGRIASIDDLTGLPRDRTDAIRRNRTEYLTSVMTEQYTTLTTADAAYKQILSRLSALVEGWRTSFTAFATNPSQLYNLPVPGVSVEAERTATYVAARDARIALETTRDAAQTAKEACERDCVADKAIYNFLVADVAFLNDARNVVASITEVGTTNVKDFVLRTGSYSADERSYQALLDSKKASLNEYAARVRACDVRCAALGDALLTAQRAVTSAQITERNALVDVYAVCPSFDPNAV